MDGHAMSMRVVLAFGLCLCAGLVYAAEDLKADVHRGPVVATLDKDQIKEFAAFVHVVGFAARKNVCLGAFVAGKAGERCFVQELSQEFGWFSRRIRMKSKSLYQLMTNKLDEAGSPEKKLIRKPIGQRGAISFASHGGPEVTEQQLSVLVMLNAEKAEETKLLDERLGNGLALIPKEVTVWTKNRDKCSGCRSETLRKNL